MAGTLMTKSGLLLLCALAAAQAQAQLTDPTRPPPALAASAPASGATPASAPAAPKAPELQALRLGRNLPPLALIDDKLVRIGDRVGAASVLAISEEGVLMRVGRGPDQWLRLNPDVLKCAPEPVAARQPPRGGRDNSGAAFRCPETSVAKEKQ